MLIDITFYSILLHNNKTLTSMNMIDSNLHIIHSKLHIYFITYILLFYILFTSFSRQIIVDIINKTLILEGINQIMYQ